MSSKGDIYTGKLGMLGSKNYPAVDKIDLNSEMDSLSDSEQNSLMYLWYDLETYRNITDRDIELELKLFTEKLSQESYNNGPRRLNPFFKRIMNSAALLAIGALLSFFTFTILENQQRNSLSDQLVTVPLGSRSQLTLPDGSKLDLNAGSTLSYSKDFGRKNRDVSLVGEAFFHVSQDAKKVFSVRTKDMIVKAYGTAFNVKAYPEEIRTEATLVEGVIGIEKPGFKSRSSENLILKPNERIVYYSEAQEQIETLERKRNPRPVRVEKSKGQVVVSKGIQTDLFTSWKEGKLILKSEPLFEMAIKLERKYNVSITFEDTDLRNFRFSGTFETETIEQVLEAIRIASQIDYSIEDRDIKLLKSK